MIEASDTLGRQGEAAALRRIIRRLPAAADAELGPGDDSAIVAAPDGRFVVSTDLLVHGPDFRLAWSMPYDLGWKAAASNLADIAAMGARPTALVVALAAPLETPVTDLEAIADGLRDGCDALAPGTGVVGGDLSASDTLTIAVTVFGDLEGRRPVLRSGARPGDVVALRGDLGLAGAGIRLLFRDAVDAEERPDRGRFTDLESTHPELVRAQLRPSPPIAAGVTAGLAGATAMLDVSDGLLIDAARIAAASGAGIDFESAALAPFASRIVALAPDLADEAPDLVLSGGEDHPLLAAFSAEDVPEGFVVLGRVVEGDTVTIDGRDPSLARGGWDPFGDWNGAVG
ncbi:thiamine-phosphate kinase [Herbiconiux sp. L3-i23]|uniref:thiamine-phosphate kinase n=1 Tax=Herbiconiux sp. L3-i23 TaxID=2905871 RepID=UPI0020662102|nr:thiamine-phosphate kinase [Herbiconiux sp. L3-i23]BDI21831.1 thiamine-monophosphate kinase [Herbiconiux sp. L3-i23]